MHPKKELYNELRKIVDNILKIIEKRMDIHDIKADIWLSDIETFAGEDDKATEDIMLAIMDEYNLPDDLLESYFDPYTPLVMIALMAYLHDDTVVADE
jgi:uncharacterized protein YajQ (UPF0234 family)